MSPGGEKVLILLRPGRQGPSGRAEMRLPKGHIEPGESHLQAALREVEEEAGLAEIRALASLGHQTVEFDWQGAHHIRQEHYFLMRVLGEVRTGSAESQFEPLWLSWEEALTKVTFEAEREWIRRARSAWERWAQG
ncbi:MAG: NUDIX domain-containing protein [Anaerolineae bacterium]|nr:NUDIX domain-containing protein [Anaerolineae bacterium]